MYRWSRVHLLGRGVEHNMLTATMEAIWHTEASRVGLLTFRGRKKKEKTVVHLRVYSMCFDVLAI